MVEELEVRLNVDEQYVEGHPEEGLFSRMLVGEEREKYLDGTFQELVKYVLNSQENVDETQADVRSMISDKIARQTPANRVIVKLYDSDNNPLAGQMHPVGDIYLDDIVRNVAGDDAYQLNIGISSISSVG